MRLSWKRFGIGATAFAILGLSACVPTPMPTCAAMPTAPEGPEAPNPKKTDKPNADTDLPKLIEAHNRERTKRDLSPLKVNTKLEAAAKVHALDMAGHETMSHEGSDGSSPEQRIERQKYPAQRSGENVAAGQETVDRVMTSWMNSKHHRANILGDFNEIGAAVAEDAEGRPYWCVVFGKPYPQADPANAAKNLVAAINKVRAEEDKPPLSSNPKLQQAAQATAREMARSGKLDSGNGDAAVQAGQGIRLRLSPDRFGVRVRSADGRGGR